MNPASPNLANLKKRAKTVLRQHASRHVPVAERIRRALPAFAGRSDREVLAAPFTLAQAQEVIARELSFADWAQLKRSIGAMSAAISEKEPRTDAEPAILHVQPHVFVTDFARALAFYRDRLGFAVALTYGDPPYFGQVERDGARLCLRHVDVSPWDFAVRRREDLLSATFVVRNAKALYLALRDAGATFHQPYREQPWGVHDFITIDPDGNLIHFASEVGAP